MAYPINEICPRCGVLVRVGPSGLMDQIAGRWFAEDREHRILETQVFASHRCDPAAVEEYTEEKSRVLTDLGTWAGSRLALLESDPVLTKTAQKRLNESQQRLDEAITENALTRPCPKCQTAPGDPCENLTERRRGNHVHTARPHAERLPDPTTVETCGMDRLVAERDERYRELDRLRSQDAQARQLTLIIDLLTKIRSSRP